MAVRGKCSNTKLDREIAEAWAAYHAADAPPYRNAERQAEAERLRDRYFALVEQRHQMRATSALVRH